MQIVYAKKKIKVKRFVFESFSMYCNIFFIYNLFFYKNKIKIHTIKKALNVSHFIVI